MPSSAIRISKTSSVSGSGEADRSVKNWAVRARLQHRVQRHRLTQPSGDDVGRLAGAGKPAIARAQPQLPLPGDISDQLGLVLLPEQQLAADPGREAVGPGRLDQQPTGGTISGLGEAAAFEGLGTIPRTTPEAEGSCHVVSPIARRRPDR